MAAQDPIAPQLALSPGPLTAVPAVHRALDLLSRASSDWRNPHADVAGPVHWAVAVAHARQALRGLLDALDGPQALASLGIDLDDAKAGRAWYNQATRAERTHWHEIAGSAVPADAWRAFQSGGLHHG